MPQGEEYDEETESERQEAWRQYYAAMQLYDPAMALDETVATHGVPRPREATARHASPKAARSKGTASRHVEYFPSTGLDYYAVSKKPGKVLGGEVVVESTKHVSSPNGGGGGGGGGSGSGERQRRSRALQQAFDEIPARQKRGTLLKEDSTHNECKGSVVFIRPLGADLDFCILDPKSPDV